PPLATSVINTQAVDLLTSWITLPPVSHIVDLTLLPDRNLQFTVAGAMGWTNIVEAATNLSAPVWVALGTNVFDGDGLTIFVDMQATNFPARFYRGTVP